MTDTTAVQRPTSTQVARSAVLMIGVLAFAKVFSLSEKWIGLDRFGIGSEWDTFAVANQLPEQLYILLAGGALSFAFIPVFSGFLGKGDKDKAWRLSSNVLNTVFLVALVAAIVAFIFAPQLIQYVLAPGFATPVVNMSQPIRASVVTSIFHVDLVAQTAGLMRILLFSTVIFSVSGLVSGILYTHQHFLLPALTPIMYDVGNLLGVVVLSRYFGVYGAAIGAVVGACLHFLIQVPGLIYYKVRWLPILDWRDPSLREVIRLMIPRSIALGLANFNLLMAYNIASGLGEGSSAALNRGYSLMQLPETLIGTAMGIVIFPTLAALNAAGDHNGKRSALSGALRFILIAAIPAAVIMVLAGRPLVGILEGGQFDSGSAGRVFSVLQFWALGIVTHSALEIVARGFFADKDMITPLLASVVEAVINISLALLLAPRLGVGGLALANSIAVGVECLILTLILRRRWQGIDEKAVLVTLGKTFAATVVMAVAVMAVTPAVGALELFRDRRLVLLTQGGILVLVGGIVYLVTTLVLRMEEVYQLPGLILRRRRAEAVAMGD
ncbi:MAG: murein biosynthesis integral membrane protein MurJ [Anaerolineae bacterium]|nr:murein biosynthesis integral membrane protein MurJ [Anaerolineae bacterium]